MPTLLGATAWRWSLTAGVVGVIVWLPSSFVLFRVLFFPGAPDVGLADESGRPVSARDLRLALLARSVEHSLGTAPLLVLIPGIFRTLDTKLALVAGLAVAVWVGWREVTHTGRALVEDADILLHSRRPAEALSRVAFATRWLPGTGDAGLVVLARAKFRTGDPRGAVNALDRVRDRSVSHADLLRAQMGVAFLPRAEVEDAIVAAESRSGLAVIAAILRALLSLHDDGTVPEAVRRDLAGACVDGRGLPCLLAAAGVADRDPEQARRMLAGWSEREWGPLFEAWPAVGRALGPVLGSP